MYRKSIRSRNNRASQKVRIRSRKSENAKGNGVFVMPNSFRSAPTFGGIPGRQYSLYKAPLFPAVVMQRGQIYYDSNLTVTAPNTGNAASYVFSANGLYDPDITGTGHQPMGFDQMMSLYNQFTCVRSTIEIWPVGANLTYALCISLQPAASISTNSGVIVENGQNNLMVDIPISVGIGRRVDSLSLSCDVAKYFGRKTHQEMLNDVNLFGTAASNPTEQVYFAVSAWLVGALGGQTTPVQFSVRLTYDAIYWEPKKESESVSARRNPLSVIQEVKSMSRSDQPSWRSGPSDPGRPPFR